MKKKIIITILILIIVSFCLGLLANIFKSYYDRKELDRLAEESRLFENPDNIPVSNSKFLGGNYVFKSFYQYSDINTKDFKVQDEFIYKKITSYHEYLEYKNLIPEIRNLTEDDFIHYYLVVVLSTEIEYVYTLEGPEPQDNSITLNILKNKFLGTQNSTPIYTGLSIVIPNSKDFPEENIKFIDTTNYEQ